jgi:hypothetical protein
MATKPYLPPYMDESQLVPREPIEFSLAAGDLVFVTSGGPQADKARSDLALWSDAQWHFQVSAPPSQPSAGLSFGSATSSDPVSLLVCEPEARLLVPAFIVGAQPFPQWTAAAYQTVGPWWLDRGGIHAVDEDLSLRAAAPDGAAPNDVRVGAEGGVWFVVESRDTIGVWLGDDRAVGLNAAETSFDGPLQVNGRLQSSEAGIQVREDTNLPGPGDGTVGELRAIEDATGVYLVVKTEPTIWRRTESFS